MNRTSLHFIWLLSAIVTSQLHVSIAGSPNETTLVIINCILALQTIYGFLVQGGSFLSASSIALYGILLFAIFPAFYVTMGLLPYEHRTDVESLIITSALVGVLQWLILALCPPRSGIPRVSWHSEQQSVGVGRLSLLLFTLTLLVTETSLTLLPNAMGIVAILLAAIAVVVAITRARLVFAVGLLSITLAFYVFYIFEGFGRLILGMVVLGVLSILSLRFSGYFIKLFILIATIPAVIVLSYQRMNFLEERRGSEIEFDEGIGSVVGPFTSAATIINRMFEGNIELSLGGTLFAALVFWVPSAWWNEKPPGFGTEIVPVTQPQLANVSAYSDAALTVGEAVWNFGIWGAWLWFILFAVWIRTLDKWSHSTLHALAQKGFSLAAACKFTLITLLSCGLINLIWGSTHTYTSRLAFPAAILLLLWGLNALKTDMAQGKKVRLKSTQGV